MALQIVINQRRIAIGRGDKAVIERFLHFVIHAVTGQNRPRQPEDTDRHRQSPRQHELQAVFGHLAHKLGSSFNAITNAAHGMDHRLAQLAPQAADINLDRVAFDFRAKFIKRFFKLCLG